ncbi:hypothetical protein BJ170DRAFT_253621 [Xylariales sp. AK1849]|nr:hypothetical protein BJ170DRAFT_253621 [Xylariales sp. AK1849]
MCNGHTVLLAGCGHELYHFSGLCGRDCELPRGPTYNLADCCADCDLGGKITWVRFDAERMVAELTRNAKYALVEGHHSEAEKNLEVIPKIIEGMQNEQSRIRRNSIGVSSAIEPEFLPCEDMTQLELSSEWIDGKCVWSDPPSHGSRTLRRIPGVAPWLETEHDAASVIANTHSHPEFKRLSVAELEIADQPEAHSFQTPHGAEFLTSTDRHHNNEASSSESEDSTTELWLRMADVQSTSGETPREARSPPIPEDLSPWVANAAAVPTTRASIVPRLQPYIPGAFAVPQRPSTTSVDAIAEFEAVFDQMMRNGGSAAHQSVSR